MSFERPNIARMQGYTWGEQPQDKQTIKLNTNENPYPPSPAVQAALQNLNADQLRVYPQPTADSLRDDLANYHNVARDNIVVTNGGDEALRLAFTTFVEPGGHFGTTEPSYSLYNVLAAIADAPIKQIDLDASWQWPEDFPEQLNAAGVQLTCVVNPHAPSGTLYPLSKLQSLAERLDGVLLVDEAYADFVDVGEGYSSTPLLQRDNVLILRTFSKGYGLAGLRLGYLLGAEELIHPILSKTRDSYNIDLLSQTLGQAAINDLPYAQRTWSAVRQDRAILAANLSQLGLHSETSHTNFLLTTVPQSLPVGAKDLYLQLKDAGILVRYFETPRLRDKLRISIGTPEQNQMLVEALTNLLVK